MTSLMIYYRTSFIVYKNQLSDSVIRQTGHFVGVA